MTHRYERQYTFFCYAALILLTCILLFAGLFTGSVSVTPADILLHQADPTQLAVLFAIRMPRILASILLGGALSVSGFLLQTFFSNPIAGPFVLGISSGAKLCVAFAMVAALNIGFLPSDALLITAAFGGSLLSIAFVLASAKKAGNMSILIVCGIMVGYICSAATEFVIAFADESNIVNLHNWSMGSFSGTDWADVQLIVLIVLPCMLGCMLLSKPMNAYRMGETYARSLGVPIRSFRAALVLVSGLLSACVTAFAGPISFVGIAVPHLIRSLLRSGKPLTVIPACFLGGGCFCLFCDSIARTVFAPTELSISTVTALFGAPVVLHLMLSRKSGKEMQR